MAELDQRVASKLSEFSIGHEIPLEEEEELSLDLLGKFGTMVRRSEDYASENASKPTGITFGGVRDFHTQLMSSPHRGYS